MRYIAFTICFAATIVSLVFLSGINLSPPQVEQVAEVEQFESGQPVEPINPPEKLSQLNNYPCPNSPMPHNNLPFDGEDSKMLVSPDDKFDYKGIIINPCLPNPR